MKRVPGDSSALLRRMPIGAELQHQGGVHFRVWAPRAETVALHLEGTEEVPLKSEGDGYFSIYVSGAGAGSRYGYRLDNDQKLYPDPASRSQPDGPHELSRVVDPDSYPWSDQDWRGVQLAGQIFYELHIGTFTPEGTWRAAAEKLPLLGEVGISVIEMMPVADFPGRFGWGYDGVGLFAPVQLYGDPDDLRYFIDRAHQIGIGVILDVVYNHFGPDGNYLPCFSDTYLTDKYPNEWGQAINFDGPGSEPVREFVRENAAYWVREFHFDGLRLDATQQIFDSSKENILTDLTRYARAAAGNRDIVLVAENEPQDSRLVRSPSAGGYGLDAIWNDDFHHSSHVALTGHNEAYYSDYKGSARELAATVKYGFLYQGQRSTWQNKRRGSPSLDIDPTCRMTFLENHDQVANSGRGQRLVELTDFGRLRAITALLLLGPGTPLLFQGQEFATSTPFLFFADHNPELARLVAKGRREFLMQFPSLHEVDLDAPHEQATFEKSKVDWSERATNAWAVALHRDLIALRGNDPVFKNQARCRIEASTLSDEAFLVRYIDTMAGDRLLIVNLGRDLSPRIFPEPLLAPPTGRSWHLLWSSEDVAYGGGGIVKPETEDGRWHFPGHASLVLIAS